jgi:hypothetical protein
MALDKVTLDDLGRVRRVTITKDSTTLVASGDHQQAVSERVAAIKRELEGTDSDYDREKLNERIAKLAGGVAVIKVGAPTETELRNRKLRIEDALNATRAAVEEGIVAGGGNWAANGGWMNGRKLVLGLATLALGETDLTALTAGAAGLRRVAAAPVLALLLELLPLGSPRVARAAMANWTRTLAGELGGFAITANLIMPGSTRTQRLESIIAGRAKRSGGTTRRGATRSASPTTTALSSPPPH